MTRPGRLIALILLVLAMLAETGAPALAAQPRDAFGQPICTAMGVSSGKADQKQTPGQLGHAHDCCAAACAAGALAIAPPGGIAAAFTLSTGVIARHPVRAGVPGPRGPPVRFAEARGPPTPILTV